MPETVLINPVITPLDDEIEEGWEGCLSVPGVRGLVPRHRRIRYRGIDQHGHAIDREVTDFHARVVQHECDHLDGILYPFRITDMKQFGFKDTLLEHDVMQRQPCDDGVTCPQRPDTRFAPTAVFLFACRIADYPPANLFRNLAKSVGPILNGLTSALVMPRKPRIS